MLRSLVMSPLSLVSTHWAAHQAPARLSQSGASYRWPGPAASCRHGVTPWTNQRPGNWRRALIGRESDGARGRLVMVRLASASHFSRGIIKTRKPEKTDWRVQRPGHHNQSVWPLGDSIDTKWWHHEESSLTWVWQAGANLTKSENENAVQSIIIIISSIMMNKNYGAYKSQIAADTRHCFRR